MKRHYEAVAELIALHNAAEQVDLISALNPRIRGWANYYSTVVSKVTYSRLDHLVCQRLLRWGYRRHPNKSRQWVAAKYFNLRRNKGSIRPWDFMVNADRRLLRYADTRIQRHIQVNPARSPFDGDFAYWTKRLKKYPAASISIMKLLQKQNGKCLQCGLYFRSTDWMETIQLTPRERPTYEDLGLFHQHCLGPMRASAQDQRRIHDNNHAAEEPYERETLTYGSEERRGRRLPRRL